MCKDGVTVPLNLGVYMQQGRSQFVQTEGQIASSMYSTQTQTVSSLEQTQGKVLFDQYAVNVNSTAA